MTLPTSREKMFAWHTAALADIALHLELEIHDEIQCGWFKRRLVRQGPWVPVRIWLFQSIEDGELVGDDKWQCDMNGHCVDAEDQWPWVCQNPITEAEYNYMTANIAWTADNAPDEPMANPRDKVDWTKVPVPQFTKEQSK